MRNPADQEARRAQAVYAPRAQEERRGVALCLSGGGYRAALFHLGAVRRLNELGVLSQVDTICSVSGGSILAAHLATAVREWPTRGSEIARWPASVAEPFLRFTERNIRTRPLLRRLLPWNWLNSGIAVEALAGTYRKHLTALQLSELSGRPRFIFCATDLSFGVNWVFDSGRGDDAPGRVGDYQAGYISPPPPWSVARAVAASSCFPPVFAPMKMRLHPANLVDGAYDKIDRDALGAQIRLSDGGVYDNLGLEPVWKDHAVVLVSDGGGVFEPERDAGLGWRLERYTSIITEQGRALRKRWLISNFLSGELDGTYWGIGSAASHYAASGYSERVVDAVISEVRTDLDAFSDAEQAVLQNHGYLMADAAIQRHAKDLVRIPGAPKVPYPAWMDERAVEAALANSHVQRLLGRWG